MNRCEGQYHFNMLGLSHPALPNALTTNR